MVSFSQNGEDVLIDRVFRKSNGFFIDVGAYHPVFDSVTKVFSVMGWRGINIEPDEEMFAELSRDRPNDINLNCAAGKSRGKATFHRLRNRAMSTISSEQVGQLQAGDLAGSQLSSVDVRPLADICMEYVKEEIDFLKIDAEGSEGDVIMGADWERFRPRLLVIESTKPWSSELNCESWEAYLLSKRYSFQHFDGINRYYVREEDHALGEQLSVPVNVLDCFITYRELQLKSELEAHRKELQHMREHQTIRS